MIPADDTVAALRRAFDASFAAAPTVGLAGVVDLLAIRIAREPYLLRLPDVAALTADRAITRLPGPVPELVGVAGFRGAVVPVFDLRAVLGLGVTEGPRWLVLVTGPIPLAFAFEAFDGYRRVRADAFSSPGATAGAHVREIVRIADQLHPVVNVDSIRESISARALAREP